MSATRKKWLDHMFLVLGWLLATLFLLFISAILTAQFKGGSWVSSMIVSSMNWIMLLLLMSNLIASLLGLFCIFATSAVTELRITWLLSFLFALMVGANVVLIPLFRHYVLNKTPSS